MAGSHGRKSKSSSVNRGSAQIDEVPVEVVRPLRQAILRPHQGLAEQVYPGDALPGAAHFAARAAPGGEPVGIASVSPEPHPHAPQAGDWRVRGMATAPAARGTGAGGRLLAACLAHARTHGATRVWCNARTPARGFYERAGFTTEGEEFELPDIGPHVLMTRSI
jgi:GNAT superfamily N-acetyltransferase